MTVLAVLYTKGLGSLLRARGFPGGIDFLRAVHAHKKPRNGDLTMNQIAFNQVV